MINITGALLVILALCALLFVSSVNEGFANAVSSSYGNSVAEGFANEMGSSQGPQVSWPGGVVSPPPYSVTAGSDTGYHW